MAWTASSTVDRTATVRCGHWGKVEVMPTKIARSASSVQGRFTLAVIVIPYGTAPARVLRGGRRRGALHARRAAAGDRPAGGQPADPAPGGRARPAAAAPRPAHGEPHPGRRGAAALRARRSGPGRARA